MMRNQRTAYGEALVKLGADHPNVVALEADLGKSTMSNLFEQAYPNRYFQMGIAEANMVSTAAGLALTGFVPFVHSFAVFASGRAYDQIRSSVCIPRLNVRICGSSAGLSDFGDGKTHQSVDDIAIMRVLPNMTVLSPCDADETEWMVAQLGDFSGPVYLRVNRNDLPALEGVEPFELGKPRLMREGGDIAVFATGVMVSMALEAAEALAQEGISVRVVNIHTIKPLDAEAVRAHTKGVRQVLTAEEHSVIGGLGSAVLEALSGERLPVELMGIQDCFGTSAANYAELMAKYGLTAEAMANRIRTLLK